MALSFGIVVIGILSYLFTYLISFCYSSDYDRFFFYLYTCNSLETRGCI